eukprot:6178156-Pleurochrysis_carterae.AAC.2
MKYKVGSSRGSSITIISAHYYAGIKSFCAWNPGLGFAWSTKSFVICNPKQSKQPLLTLSLKSCFSKNGSYRKPSSIACRWLTGRWTCPHKMR